MGTTAMLLIMVLLAILAFCGIAYGISQRETINKLSDEIRAIAIALTNHKNIADSHLNDYRVMIHKYEKLFSDYKAIVNTLNQIKKLEELKSKAQPVKAKNEHDDNII